MIAYAVNKHTKEHKMSGPLKGMGWILVYADQDGWIKHDGSKSPLPDGSVCEIKPWAGGISKGRSEDIVWDNVAAYRPILDADTKPEPPAWGGEGLPPVGCECECSLDFGQPKKSANWAKVEVLYVDRSTVVGRIIEGPNWKTFSNGFEAGLYKFRPLRSEEDGAVDEMVSLFNVEDGYSFHDLCRTLYRAGYRKQ